MVARLWKVGHTTCGRLATWAALVFALLTSSTVDANAESFVRRLAQRALERGLAQEARGDIAQALTSYDEAVRTDSTLGAAAMRLGGLRERMGDRSEAELLYTHALSAPETRADALYARALLRGSVGRRAEAVTDLAESIELSPRRERLRVLGGWYIDSRAWPAALSIWRALAAHAEAAGDTTDLREARLTVTALSWLASDTDPVQAGSSSSDWVRRSLSRIARATKTEAHGARKLTP